jgi:hypothetical protein
MEKWDGRERRRATREGADKVQLVYPAECPLEDMVMSHEHILFGNREEMTSEQLAAGQGGGLIASTKKLRETSQSNNRLLRVVLIIIIGQLLGQAIPWPTVGKALSKLFVP